MRRGFVLGCRYAVPQVTQPIFTAGRLKSNVQLAEAERELALIAHQRVRESRMKQEALVIRIAGPVAARPVRYRGEVVTQLNALDADWDLFLAQFDLAQIRLNEPLSVVHLYKALGEGWH
jgi:multidrug efflux system outer membrane protein